MITYFSYAEIAASFDLWQDRFDTYGVISREEFDAMTIDERIALMVDAPIPANLTSVYDSKSWSELTDE